MLGDLTPEEIERLLRSEAIGRIGCYGFGRPYVVPVTYAYDGVAVYCHSREGLKLRMMRNHPTVCFEVDRVDGVSDWQSVIATGRFSELEAMEAELAMQLLRSSRAPRAGRTAASTPRATRGRSSASCWQNERAASSGRTRETRRTEVALKHPKSEAGRARARRRGAGLPSLKAAHSAATTAA